MGLTCCTEVTQNAEVCQLINFIIQEADEEVAVCEMTRMVRQFVYCVSGVAGGSSVRLMTEVAGVCITRGAGCG